jgi:hypothetical protein
VAPRVLSEGTPEVGLTGAAVSSRHEGRRTMMCARCSESANVVSGRSGAPSSSVPLPPTCGPWPIGHSIPRQKAFCTQHTQANRPRELAAGGRTRERLSERPHADERAAPTGPRALAPRPSRAARAAAPRLSSRCRRHRHRHRRGPSSSGAAGESSATAERPESSAETPAPHIEASDNGV